MLTLERILERIKTNFDSDIAFEEAAGLKRKTVDNCKRGLSQSYMKMIPKLCSVFNVTTDYLLGTEKPAAPEGGQPVDERRMLLIEKIKKMSDEDFGMTLDYVETRELAKTVRMKQKRPKQ